MNFAVIGIITVWAIVYTYEIDFRLTVRCLVK